MIRIRELYRLQNIHGLRLIAGQDGLERTVTAAVLFEYDPSRMQLADFYRGDLVVTTLAYARGDAQLVTHSLLALMNQGIAGLMVKTAYFSELPEAVVDMANRMGTPLFLFDETYIEEAILEVTDLIHGKRRFAGYEKELDALMRGELTPEQIREKVARIDPLGAGAYRLAALYPREHAPGLDERLYALLSEKNAVAGRGIVMEWRRALILLLCFEEEDQREDGEVLEALGALLARAGGEGICAGISRRREEKAAFCISLAEAVYAARAARLERRTAMTAGELGLYAWLFPMSENAFVCEQCRRGIAAIRDYDAQNRANLEHTARVYVEKGMEIAAAAKALYQHPNTVRYRLSKIQRLMGMEDDAMFAPMISLTVCLLRIMEESERG
ncbi:MAG: PucR family transcriptional regulator ligand-binding domain-containing protein [Clostridia bacterium]|nr:PucR family transcriptional regulator ligand-binding domain-containing protein [Clostridia bacterium]